MALRSQILSTSLSLLSTHSFARPTLVQALRTLKPEISNPDAVIDTLFGSGSVEASKALVGEWEEEGLNIMNSNKEGKVDLGEVLKRRLEYSAEVGEHFIEAQANLTTPSSTPLIPIPSLMILRKLMSTINVPTSYTPPPLSSSTSSTNSALSSSILDQISQATGGKIPLLHINPLGPLGYAWKIADQAINLTEKKGDKSGLVRRGYWNEPTGSGPEWYTKRLGLSLVYLASESHLLQPYPPTSTTLNPHLPKALISLEINLQRYKTTIASLEGTEESLGDVAGFIDYVARSWGGLIRSRYF